MTFPVCRWRTLTCQSEATAVFIFLPVGVLMEGLTALVLKVADVACPCNCTVQVQPVLSHVCLISLQQRAVYPHLFFTWLGWTPEEDYLHIRVFSWQSVWGTRCCHGRIFGDALTKQTNKEKKQQQKCLFDCLIYFHNFTRIKHQVWIA